MPIPDYLKKTVIVFDTETAVLRDHVCEIGFSVFKNAQLVYEWGTLIRPIIEIEAEAEAVHKISNADVEDFPLFQQIAPWCYNILNSADIHCAYNYEFDREVLENEFSRCGIKFPLKPMIDPMIFFKKWNKYNKGKKLINATQRYGIEYVGAHRAVNDSTVTGNLLFKMAAVRVDFPKTLQKIIAIQRKLIQAQHEDFTNYRKSMGQELPTLPKYQYYEI